MATETTASATRALLLDATTTIQRGTASGQEITWRGATETHLLASAKKSQMISPRAG
jgi:hypothetical protein